MGRDFQANPREEVTHEMNLKAVWTSNRLYLVWGKGYVLSERQSTIGQKYREVQCSLGERSTI